jgi:DNA-directed RNA polymerase subunit RPC12/RpoP
MRDEMTYVCSGCGEEIVVPLDVSEGSSQDGSTYRNMAICSRAALWIEVSGDASSMISDK